VRAFFDTNVLLDVLLGRAPFYENSARVWTLAEMGRLEGYISAVSFTNVFYIVQGVRDRHEAERAVNTIVGIFTPATCDAQVIRQAVDAGVPDFEDAVQYFSALHAGVDCILSRNPDDFPHRPAVPVLSPTEFLGQLERE
jgi:predicted nucleic acid-binding protein